MAKTQTDRQTHTDSHTDTRRLKDTRRLQNKRDRHTHTFTDGKITSAIIATNIATAATDATDSRCHHRRRRWQPLCVLQPAITETLAKCDEQQMRVCVSE